MDPNKRRGVGKAAILAMQGYTNVFNLGMHPAKFVRYRSITGINNPDRLRIKFELSGKKQDKETVDSIGRDTLLEVKGMIEGIKF